MEGTYPLPEAQLDRFLFRVMFDAVDAGVLQRIITERRQGDLPSPNWQASADDLNYLFTVMERIYSPSQWPAILRDWWPPRIRIMPRRRRV